MTVETGTNPRAGGAEPSEAVGADDLNINQLASNAAKAKCQAREVEELVSQLVSQLPDDDLPREIARARDNASTIYGLAETIERELQCAKADPRTGRKQVSAGRVQELGRQVNHMLDAVGHERAALIQEVAAHHPTTGHAREESPLAKAVAPVVDAFTKPAKKLAKAAPKLAVAAAASNVAETTVAEPAPLARLVTRAKSAFDGGVEKAKHVAARVSDTVGEVYDSARETVGHSVEKAKQLAKTYLPAPVVGALRSMRDTSVHAWQVTSEFAVHPLDETKRLAKTYLPVPVVGVLRSVRDTALHSYDSLVALLPWGEKPAEKLAKIVEKPVPKPKGATTKTDSMLCRAMKQAAAVGLPLATQGQGLACQLADVTHQILPDFSAISTHMPWFH